MNLLCWLIWPCQAFSQLMDRISCFVFFILFTILPILFFSIPLTPSSPNKHFAIYFIGDKTLHTVNLQAKDRKEQIEGKVLNESKVSFEVNLKKRMEGMEGGLKGRKAARTNKTRRDWARGGWQRANRPRPARGMIWREGQNIWWRGAYTDVGMGDISSANKHTLDWRRWHGEKLKSRTNEWIGP